MFWMVDAGAVSVAESADNQLAGAGNRDAGKFRNTFLGVGYTLDAHLLCPHVLNGKSRRNAFILERLQGLKVFPGSDHRIVKHPLV